jgi:uncharacterized protein with HEPN domain
MPKDDKVYLTHMLELAQRVRDKVSGVTREQFDADDNLQLAVTHLIQTIGEAARMVSPAGRAAVPALPWNAITGMRHHIVHDYLNVDVDIVWQTATTRMEELIAALRGTGTGT